MMLLRRSLLAAFVVALSLLAPSARAGVYTSGMSTFSGGTVPNSATFNVGVLTLPGFGIDTNAAGTLTVCPTNCTTLALAGGARTTLTANIGSSVFTQAPLNALGNNPILKLIPGAFTNTTASTESNGFWYTARTNQWLTGALATQREFYIQAPTYSFVGASTIAKGSTVSISGPPIAGTNATISTALALDIESGYIQLSGATSGLQAPNVAAVIGVDNIRSFNATLNIGGSPTATINFGNTSVGDLSITGKRYLFNQNATAGATLTWGWRFNAAAHTNLTASTEATDFMFDANRVVQFATGALATQRATIFGAPTYAFVGASTITTAATVDIIGPPVAGTNATITSSYALRVEAGTSQFGGPVQIGSGTFASLGTPNNGMLVYCSDCTIANPCASGGTGALAKRLNGVWVCN
jgi:hypothetical protein